MQFGLMGVFEDGDVGPALEGSGEFIEPPHLTPGESASTGSYQVFGLIQVDLP
jgi:hypothetical protein